MLINSHSSTQSHAFKPRKEAAREENSEPKDYVELARQEVNTAKKLFMFGGATATCTFLSSGMITDVLGYDRRLSAALLLAGCMTAAVTTTGTVALALTNAH